MHVTNLMIDKTLLGLLESMSQSGVPLRSILMRAVADGIVADHRSGVTEYLAAEELVQWYVDTMANRFTGDAR